MRRIMILLVMTILVLMTFGCEENLSPRRVVLNNYADSLSFALGFIYGMDIADVAFEFNYRLIFQGISNARDRNLEILTEDQIIDLISHFHDVMTGISQQETEITLLRNQFEGSIFMQENALRDDVTSTPSGLQYRIIRPGTGRAVRSDSDVTVHYTGRFIDGEIFDSSHNRGEPTGFNVNDVILGWSEGLQLMREGAIFELVIPDSLAYGRRGFDIIEPGAYLIFEVEVISVN